MSSQKATTDLDADEAVQYDRQIRLWGTEAQQRFRAARVLVIGAKGLAAEVTKNIVLAGIRSLTLLDDAAVSVEDLGAQFFLTEDDIGKNRAASCIARIQELNPRVAVEADTSSLASKPDEFFTNFEVVLCTAQPLASLTHINDVCRKHNVAFFAGDIFGFFGHFFADLGSTHEFIEEARTKKEGEAEETVTLTKSTLEYASLSSALSSPPPSGSHTPALLPAVLALAHAPHGRLTAEQLAAKGVAADLAGRIEGSLSFELSPVAAIVGGILAAEILKALSKRDKPVHNMFFYDGASTYGVTALLGSPARAAAPAALVVALELD